MNILILGNSGDAHALAVEKALAEAGVIADYFDTSLFPTQLRISWEPVNQTGYLYNILYTTNLRLSSAGLRYTE